MNASLISLLGIFFGIMSTNIFGLIYKKYSFTLLGNTIIGVFGSIFFTKLVAKFKINPFFITENKTFQIKVFIVYIIVSIIGAIVFQIITKKIILKVNEN